MKFDLKKKLVATALAGAVAIGAGSGASSAYAAQADRESIAQVALLQSLAQGYFGGTVTAGQLRTFGDIVVKKGFISYAMSVFTRG